MERSRHALTQVDELFLERACELAARGIGNTAPNPPVGAVLVREGRIAGEGYHHRAGEAHAEVLALRAAGEKARGATLYISLEPCAHVGRTPPCTKALIEAGVVRVVAGAADPTGHGDLGELRAHGIDTIVVEHPQALALIEIFAKTQTLTRPFVALKMAMSLDGFVASQPGVREQLTGEQTRRRVRELRVAYDAVMVGARTIRVDDPLLTVRPPHQRLRAYVRVVLCESGGVAPQSRIFKREEGYARTLVLAPAALAPQLAELAEAEVIGVGAPDCERLDLVEALAAVRRHGVYSVLCEGGPTLAARLLEARLVDRLYWAIAPRFLERPGAVPVLAGDVVVGELRVSYDRAERLGDDVLLSGVLGDV